MENEQVKGWLRFINEFTSQRVERGSKEPARRCPDGECESRRRAGVITLLVVRGERSVRMSRFISRAILIDAVELRRICMPDAHNNSLLLYFRDRCARASIPSRRKSVRLLREINRRWNCKANPTKERALLTRSPPRGTAAFHVSVIPLWPGQAGTFINCSLAGFQKCYLVVYGGGRFYSTSVTFPVITSSRKTQV